MKLSKTQANLILFLTAIIWGGGYLFVKQATNAQMPAGMINFFRGLICAGLAYLFFHQTINRMTWVDFRIGLIAGLINFLGYQIQTIGLKYTTPSNNAFLTAIYVVIIPFISWGLFHHRPPAKSYLAVLLCVVGMLFLENIFTTGFVFRLGDSLTVISAFFYALQIVYFGFTATDSSPWIVAFMLGSTQCIFGGIWSILFERSAYATIHWHAAIVPVIILGIFSSFIAQTLQVLGQRFTDPTPAGLILMTESLFGAIFSVVFGMEAFRMNLVWGGIVIIIGLVIMQINFKRKGRPVS